MAQHSFDILPGLEDDFDQIQKIAIGGMAELYRGRQRSLDRAVAIKKVRPEYQSNKDLKDRFLREARSAGNFLHQNLAHVYDFKTWENDSYIIMEYIDGFDLSEILEASGPLPVDVAGMIAIRVLLGLGYVHSHGTVHRDIKPDNIRITVRGDVKIMDFGIALDLAEGNFTQPGIVIGSPHYLSPEQVAGARLDQRSDIFSFGITFYEMLTGKRPFTETPKKSLYERIREGKYESLQTLRPDVPGLIVGIVDRCLKVKPQERASNVESLAALLQEFIHGEYGTNFDARTRKFLMEFDFLKGNPDSILVHEKTAEVKVSGAFIARLRSYALPLLFLIVGLVGGLVMAKYFNIGSLEKSEEVVPPADDPPKARPKKKAKRPEPILPGTPVKD